VSSYHQIIGTLREGLAEVLKTLGLPHWQEWNLAVGLGLAWLFLVAWVLFLRKHIRYSIGQNHLKVLLFGIPIRRLNLDNIRHIHGRKTKFAERWSNMVITRHDRVLVMEKHRGLIKQFLITPDKRYVFRADLERAIRARSAAKQGPAAGGIPVEKTVVVNLTFEEKPAATMSHAGH
jgi:hypothetical protein